MDAALSVIAKSAGGTPGFVKQGGTYHVYANVTDDGNPWGGHGDGERLERDHRPDRGR